MNDRRTAELAGRLAAVRESLDAAVAAADREPGDVELLVVTKFFPAADVARLIELGEREFGESREPEASRKIAELGELAGQSGAVFDMIGSVQTKKAKTVAQWARSVHSVDRDKIVDQLATGAQAALDGHLRSEPLGVFCQVSLDGDPTRGGVLETELPALADRVEAAASLRLLGLMVIAPLQADPRQAMTETARVREVFLRDHPKAGQLSAGMSSDMVIAVEYGSTCVRVGTAIMGSRPILSH
ncbi:YggS family pyridoxal phosphate-dependent enzyme [Gordonia sp. DT30]|uniref:YggS family pyridoxal phosphate-dependent enzyme n=1 Tax=unclassified Gordonia (in: high G+C Gram-positive bacteria) TaxID=2657482 RepID=UPI003CEBE636